MGTTEESDDELSINNFFSMLVPDDCTDDISAREHFSRVFQTRYDSTGPILYPGSLDEAIQDSLHLSIQDVNSFFFLQTKKHEIVFVNRDVH